LRGPTQLTVGLFLFAIGIRLGTQRICQSSYRNCIDTEDIAFSINRNNWSNAAAELPELLYKINPIRDHLFNLSQPTLGTSEEQGRSKNTLS
jgi:hypothetical protein